MKSERVPDFFIVGAPKCGTTALSVYLSSHPAVLMPELKEINFFCDDFPMFRKVSNLADYKNLFANAMEEVLIGDASSFHLYSEVAIRRIMTANRAAKIIIMLRNPVDMAHSLHAQQLFSLMEDVEQFELAWSLQRERAEGRRLPKHCLEPKHLLYKDVCCFSGQVTRVLEHVPAAQVKVVISEEFFSNLEAEYCGILDFLGLQHQLPKRFARVNESKMPRNKRLHQFLRYPPSPISRLVPPAKRLANYFNVRPRVALSRLNTSVRQRAPLDPAFRRALEREFAPDIERLEGILGRSLACWRVE
jgi:Sulfotransferase domain